MGSCPLFLFVVKEIEQVRAIAERVTRSHGLEVWDIVSRRESSGPVVRVFIDDTDVIFEGDEDKGFYRYLLTMLDGLESASAERV